MKKETNLKAVKGFTLVELLVVIAIIAILSVIGLTIFSGAQSSARDARRKSDIDAIANAIEVTKAPGTVKYTALPSTTGFSSGVVPCDNGCDVTTPKNNYCIMSSTNTVPTNLQNPGGVTITWASSTACPTAPAANPAPATGQSNWTPIPSAGLPSQNTSSSEPFYNTVAGVSTTSWVVCARLETNPATFYCKSSAQ